MPYLFIFNPGTIIQLNFNSMEFTCVILLLKYYFLNYSLLWFQLVVPHRRIDHVYWSWITGKAKQLLIVLYHVYRLLLRELLL